MSITHPYFSIPGSKKQVPLLFVFMTRRRAADYAAVLKYIKESMFPNIDVAWQALVSDFEYALIKAMKQIFPAVVHRGCEFHWAQALFKKVP